MTSPPPIFVLIALVVAIGYVFVRVRTTHFDCPTSGRSFKLSYAAFFFSVVFLMRRSGGRRQATCPYCNTGAMLEPISDKNG